MKKKVLFVASLFLATATFAQDGLTSKKGEAYLPEAGDWAIGFDANPFLNYFGNLANGNTGNSVSMPWVANSNSAIVGKMFKDETTAYRVKVRLGIVNSSQEDSIYKATYGAATTPSEYTNSVKNSGMEIVIGGGLEKRRGNTRIQGFYGGELLIGLGSGKTTYEYGATVAEDSLNLAGAANARMTEAKRGSTFMIGLRGFIGVEWFVAPKVSVAAEYGWGLAMMSEGEGENTSEYWGIAAGSTATANSTIVETSKTGGKSSMSFDNDNGMFNGATGGAATLSLYFHF